MDSNFTVDIIDEAKQAKSTYDGSRSDLDRGIADYVIPQNSAINTLKTPHTEGWTDGIYDTTVIQAQQTFSAGCYEYMLSGEWFDFTAPTVGGQKNEEADAWYRKCAEVIQELLNESNFSLMIQRHLNDRNSFGHGDICLEEGKDNLYNFRVSPVGTVFVQENDEGNVDTRYVCYEWTPRQIVNRFGEDAVSPELLDAYKDKTNRNKKKFKVWHITRPREDVSREYGKIDGKNKPWMSYWCEENAEHELLNSGFDEKPFVFSRFERWTSEYGWSPAILALPTVRAAQSIMRDLQALSELKVWPRTLVPDNFKDIIDWAAGGATVYPSNAQNGEKPEVWGDGGDYGIGKDLFEMLKEMIKDTYHVDLFKALAERTKQMTATEVMELVQEKLINFRPTFARFTTETLNPLLQRAFNMALRSGKLPPVPREVLDIDATTGEYTIPQPRPVHVSKIARALRSLENKSILEFVQQVAGLLELDPTLLTDNYDMDKLVRTVGDNNSLPTDIKRSEMDRDALRQKRAEQQQAQQAAMLAESASKSASNMGNAPPEMQQALGESLGI